MHPRDDRGRLSTCCAGNLVSAIASKFNRDITHRREMSYRWVEHTGELQLEIEAPTEEQVFGDALKALAELFGDDRHGSYLLHEIRVAGPERAVLLVEWLDELVYLAETESLVPQEVERIELTDGGVVAGVRCHRGNPRPLVKGATYHRLAFAATRDGFRATVVLDV